MEIKQDSAVLSSVNPGSLVHFSTSGAHISLTRLADLTGSRATLPGICPSLGLDEIYIVY